MQSRPQQWGQPVWDNPKHYGQAQSSISYINHNGELVTVHKYKDSNGRELTREVITPNKNANNFNKNPANQYNTPAKTTPKEEKKTTTRKSFIIENRNDTTKKPYEVIRV